MAHRGGHPPAYPFAGTPRWMRQGLCQDHDPDLWFPAERGEQADTATRLAKTICQACPVTSQCLAFALERPELGIWGGLTEKERRPLTRAA